MEPPVTWNQTINVYKMHKTISKANLLQNVTKQDGAEVMLLAI